MASDSGIPDLVRGFIARNVKTVEQLEVLLLLHENPDRTWTVSEIFQKIQSNVTTIQGHVEVLRAAGFLIAEEGNRYRFSPQNTEFAEEVKQLAEAYREKRVRVIEAIYSPRIDPAKKFADAFRFKKKE